MKHLLMIACLLLLWSCASDSVPMLPDGDGVDTPYVVIRLSVPSISNATRANPMGGEEGNGREKALPNEDKIHDINVFFYNEKDEDNRKGLDGDDDTSIFHSIYFNFDDSSDPANASLVVNEEKNPYLATSWIELKFKTTTSLPELKKGTNFAVIANIGKLEEVPATLGALRDIDLSAYSSYGSDRFLMSTAFNHEYKDYYGYSTGTNCLSKEKDIYKGVTTLQRLAARIDLWYNAKDNAGITDNNAEEITVSALSYEVENHSGDRVMLLNALPVNVMQRPSFLFKKVSAQPLTEWTKSALQGVTSVLWAGQETPQGVPTSNPEDCPTNYVFERHTLEKVSVAPSEDEDEDATLSEWYGTTRISSVKDEIMNPEIAKIAEYPSVKCLKGPHDPDFGCDRVSVIAYADENVHPVDCFRKEYLTGLIFRSIYVPEFIYKGINEDTGLPVPMNSQEVGGFNTADKLYHYSPTFGRTGPDEVKDLVFADKATALAYGERHPEDSAMLTEFNAARVDGKLGLECYYSLWLRHYNDENADPQSDYPMEYAIVRNNIYRVALTFSGPGTPEPEMREPDTMMSRIFVRKWNLREESSPMQF